jgi:hypothetical protein
MELKGFKNMLKIGFLSLSVQKVQNSTARPKMGPGAEGSCLQRPDAGPEERRQKRGNILLERHNKERNGRKRGSIERPKQGRRTWI